MLELIRIMNRSLKNSRYAYVYISIQNNGLDRRSMVYGVGRGEVINVAFNL